MARKNGFGLLSTIIIIIATAIIASISSGLILYNGYKNKIGITYDKLSKDKDLREFLDVYSELTSDYYEDVDKKAMLKKAIEAMTEFLGDKYTTYMNETEKKMLDSQLNGKYKGIGVLVQENVIKQVFDESPAFKSGVKVGDKIVKVDGEDVTGKNASEIVNLIKKNEVSSTITFLRDGKEIEKTIEFSSLDIPSVTYEKYEGNIGYIWIGSFSAPLETQFKSAISNLEKENIDSLIIDLRDNTGGYLSSANSVASIFLEKGKVIYSLIDNKGKTVHKDQTSESKDYPIIVLINENSASAAEILAAALKESYGATLVGKKSFGKGKVQQVKQLDDGTMVKYTSAKWYTPNDECVDEKGIEPDYEIDLDIIYNKDNEIEKINDTQLEKARQLLEQ